jgi:hypothetical protein
LVQTTNSNNDFLTQSEIVFQIGKSLEETESIINKSIKRYEESGDLNALNIAFNGYCTIEEMLKQVEELCLRQR